MTEPRKYARPRAARGLGRRGRWSGVAELELPLTENLDVGWCEVNVLPEHRRRGVGRAAVAGRGATGPATPGAPGSAVR